LRSWELRSFVSSVSSLAVYSVGSDGKDDDGDVEPRRLCQIPNSATPNSQRTHSKTRADFVDPRPR